MRRAAVEATTPLVPKRFFADPTPMQIEAVVTTARAKRRVRVLGGLGQLGTAAGIAAVMSERGGHDAADTLEWAASIGTPISRKRAIAQRRRNSETVV